MLLSCILTLQPEKATTVPTNLGRGAHAWFLDRVQAADPDLAQRLHSAPGQRPFTVSNLWELGRARGPETTLHPDQTYTLRLTTFSPGLSALLREAIIPALPVSFTLAGARFNIQSATLDPDRHPWAAETTFESLVQRYTLAPSVPRLVGLRFASPTAFRITGKKRAGTLPLPPLVFGGLLDKWNAFSPIQVHPDVRRFAQECLVVSSYRLQTSRIAFGPAGRRGAYTGCTGVCRYYIEVADRYWMGLIHLLAAFSQFAGVGLRTTMGLGQARKAETSVPARRD